MSELDLSHQEMEKQNFQALVFADDFAKSLTPMQNVYPSILTPVANVPLLDYLIETLILSGVQEVFLYCSNFIDKLQNYVSSKNYTKISVSLIISDDCRSLGDGLRDIETKGIIRDDFILIRGDAFINANLTSLMDVHRDRKNKDKGCAMSLILRDLGSTYNPLLFLGNLLYKTEKHTKRVLMCAKPQVTKKKTKYEREYFIDDGDIVINTRLVDCHVYMCPASLLPIFKDNSNYQTMEDLIERVLAKDETTISIYWQPLEPNDYALPITSWFAYSTLSHDILSGQAHSLNPEISKDRGWILQKDTLIGTKSIIGEDTKISRSVIGDNCKIGNHVEIENSFLLGNVTVQDDCKIKDCVLFDRSYLQKNIKMDGCIVSTGVELLQETFYTDEIVQNNENQIFSKKMSEMSEEEEKFIYFKINIEEDEKPSKEELDEFVSDVIDSLLRGYKGRDKWFSIIAEINWSGRISHISRREVNYNVVKAILMLPVQSLSKDKIPLNNENYQRTLEEMIASFNEILKYYIQTENDQEDCLRAFEEVAGSLEEAMTFANDLLHIFFDRKILPKDKIFQWYGREADDGDVSIRNEVRANVQNFIMWLEVFEETN